MKKICFTENKQIFFEIYIFLLILVRIYNMNKLFLMKNPELFQGEKYLNTNKDYFEGWYFKNTNSDNGVSFIPGININDKSKKAFIQINTKESSYFINYDIDKFKFNFNPFCIKIGNNIFSKDGISINIKDSKQSLNVYGNIKYSNTQNINTNLLNPNIMGPFSFIPSMECNHAILAMKNSINGFVNINENKISFNNSIGYIEKDWGYSFPKSYIWCQGNNFEKLNTSFMCSVADINHKWFNFRGFICVFILDNKEFKFTTYNNSKLIKYDVNNDFININFKKGSYYLNIKSKYNLGNKLYAPVKGKMEKDIFESISEIIDVELRNEENIIFSGTSKNCGVEIVL